MTLFHNFTQACFTCSVDIWLLASLKCYIFSFTLNFFFPAFLFKWKHYWSAPTALKREIIPQGQLFNSVERQCTMHKAPNTLQHQKQLPKKQGHLNKRCFPHKSKGCELQDKNASKSRVVLSFPSLSVVSIFHKVTSCLHIYVCKDSDIT